MKSGFFLITGTSRGIGKALAQSLLEEGHSVLGVSRSGPSDLQSPRYEHLKCDLADSSAITPIITKAETLFDESTCEFLCLVNNAARLEPLKSIEECSTFELEAHVQIGLIAPMALTSRFIHTFSRVACRKKVAFISSGAAVYPMLDASAYCTSKAGLNMFGRCIGLEQAEKAQAFEVVAINPGMVETAMQELARSKTSEEFKMADYFREARETGRVRQLEEVVGELKSILLGHQEPGAFVNCAEAPH